MVPVGHPDIDSKIPSEPSIGVRDRLVVKIHQLYHKYVFRQYCLQGLIKKYWYHTTTFDVEREIHFPNCTCPVKKGPFVITIVWTLVFAKRGYICKICAFVRNVWYLKSIEHEGISQNCWQRGSWVNLMWGTASYDYILYNVIHIHV